MHLYLSIVLAVCLAALVGVAAYAFWRTRRGLAAARRTGLSKHK